MNEAVRCKYPLQLPESPKKTAIRLAKEHGVSLNRWIVASVARKIGAVETAQDFVERRAKRADVDAVRALLDRAPDVPPSEGDEI